MPKVEPKARQAVMEMLRQIADSPLIDSPTKEKARNLAFKLDPGEWVRRLMEGIRA